MRKRVPYGELSEEQKEKIRSNAREAYARKVAIRNEQMLAAPIAGTSEEASVRHQVVPNRETSINNNTNSAMHYQIQGQENERCHIATTNSSDQINSCSVFGVKNWYSALSEQQREEVRKKQRAAYARKKSLTKEAIRNKQMSATPIREAFEDGIVCYEDRPNFERSVDEDECRKKRKRCFTIDEHKKGEMLIKSKGASANKTTHSGMCGQIEGLGVVINKGSERNTDNQSCHITMMNFSEKGKNQINGCSIFEVGSQSCATSNPTPMTSMLGPACSKYQRSTNLRYILRTISSKADTLLHQPACKYCQAKRFHHETKGFCCADGQISLVSNDVPDELFKLFTSNSTESIEFLKYVRTFNNKFAFTSFGVKYDKNFCRRNKGIYTFRVQGQVYHYINDLLPLDGHPSYLQLYFYDTEHEIENRIYDSDRLNPSILNKIVDILKVNPYCAFFRTLKNVPDLENHQIHIRTDAALDQRVYNAPSSSQVAAIWVEENASEQHTSRDIVVFGRSGCSHRVQYYFGCYDPLQYPLLFPYGDTGWHQGIQRLGKGKQHLPSQVELLIDPRASDSATELLKKETQALEKRKSRVAVSCREYYCYKLQIRPSIKSILLRSGRLLQQYVVDMYIKIETVRLDYFRTKQVEIRSEAYQGIIDSILIGETRGSKVGHKIILPASFIGGPRDMRKRYMEAMALVQRFGKPDIFLTMTCNPCWPEIKEELEPQEEAQNRPDLIARVFRAKLEELKIELFKKEIFGVIAAYVYVIEHQKRGLPHAHFLIILKRDWKIIAPETFDEIISAELPNRYENSHLYSTVVKHMMHGPCGVLNPSNICMKKDGTCKNHYPKNFCNETTIGNDSFPTYRRRDNGTNAKIRGKNLDNRWVVPYNPYLLAKFDSHINVEICSTIKAVKYLYKYIYKGHDRVAFNMISEHSSQDIDEIEQFQSARWITPPEAAWRIYGFGLNEMYPSVYSLQLHLENEQTVSFSKSDNLAYIVNNDLSAKSMLTEFFCRNKVDENAQKLLYKDFPEHYVWNQQDKIWTPRKKGNVIGRVVAANPIEGERYYLRLLLNHIRGPSSFEDLKRVNGIVTSTFREAALLHGLLETDNSLEKCLEEALSYQMPYSFRRLFATILVYCNPSNPRALWEQFEESMSEDFKKLKGLLITVRTKVLQSIAFTLQSMGRDINTYHLVDYNISFDEAEMGSRQISDELEILVSAEDLLAVKSLNTEQKYAYETILHKVFSNAPAVFFIDGPGGTGKTFLYRAILATIRSKCLIALATASSGVAASILPGGRTAHSRFKIPLDVEKHATCRVSKQGGLAKLLRAAKLIIWDEAPMSKKQTIEALDKMLQDVNESDLPFGGKVIVFGGDFRQVLPVVPKATRQEQINASLVTSYLWPILEKIRLTENMRAKLDPMFSEYLLQIGNGTQPVTIDDKIKLPANMIIPYIDDMTSLNALIDLVFLDINEYPNNWNIMINRAILTPKNDYVDEINNLLINRFPGEITRYCSFDETIDKTEQSIMEDFLNSLTPNGLPPHELFLKPNCPVILLRNIDPSEGLCNGTRLLCHGFKPNVIDAEIAVGDYRGKRVFIPRIPFLLTENENNPFPFKRTQFPVRLGFAMTINKAQGQTFDYVGIYLPQPVFSHGQLYVALSRAKTANSVKVLIRPTTVDNCNDNCTKNIVYGELLALANIF